MSYRKTTLLVLALSLSIVCMAGPTSATVQQARWVDRCLSGIQDTPAAVHGSMDRGGAAGVMPRGDVLDLTHPLDNDIFRAGDVVQINGTVQGPNFQSYIVEWGFGNNPTQWFTTGIELINGGSEPVTEGTLALWNTESISEATFTTLRVTAAFTGFDLVELLSVYPVLTTGIL